MKSTANEIDLEHHEGTLPATFVYHRIIINCEMAILLHIPVHVAVDCLASFKREGGGT